MPTPTQPGFFKRAAQSIFSAAASFGLRQGLIKSDIVPPGLIRIDADYRQADGTYRSQPTPHDVLQQYQASLWVFACVRAIAEAVADAPRLLKKVVQNGTDEVVTEHHALEVLDAPAPGETWQSWMRAVTSYLELDGRYFGEKVRSGEDRRIIGVNTLVNSKVRFDIHPKSGVTKVEYTPNAAGETITFDGKDVLVIRYFDPASPFTGGVSPLKPAWLSSQTDQAQREWNSLFFRNGAEPDTILNPTKEIAPVELIRLKNEFVARNTNRRNARGVFAPPFGLEIKPYGSVSMRDLQFDKLGARNRDEICAAYRVPPVVLGFIDSSLLATSDVQRQLFRDLRIKPTCRFIFAGLQPLIDELTGEPGLYYLDLDESAMMLPHELAAMQASIPPLIMAGVMAVEQARAKLGLKMQDRELPGGRDADRGDEYVQPVSDAPAEAESGREGAAEAGAGRVTEPAGPPAEGAEKSAALRPATPYRMAKARDARTAATERKLVKAFGQRLAAQKSAVVRMLLARAS